MAFYSVLTPPPDQSAAFAEQAEKTLFLKDGFIFGAFVFTGLWLLAKRLWLAFAVFLVIWAAIGFGGRAIGISPLALALGQALIGLLLGLEGNALIERKLLAKGWRLAGVVEGRDLDTAERRFFETVTPQALAPAPGLAMALGPRDTTPGAVIGLFPDARTPSRP
jgi:Protein of unknown function (DUF2628)